MAPVNESSNGVTTAPLAAERQAFARTPLAVPISHGPVNYVYQRASPNRLALTQMMQTAQVARMPSRIDMDSNSKVPASARAGTRDEALRLLDTHGISIVELDYESGWQDAVELGRQGQKVGIRVEFRGHESITVKSPAALVAGLARPNATFRQRNLYCQFDLGRLPAGELERLEAKAEKLGDYVLAGHLLREVDVVWSE